MFTRGGKQGSGSSPSTVTRDASANLRCCLPAHEQRCLATYNSNLADLRAEMPLSTCDLSLWQMSSAREAFDRCAEKLDQSRACPVPACALALMRLLCFGAKCLKKRLHPVSGTRDAAPLRPRAWYVRGGSFTAEARHLQAARVQRHRLRLDETIKGLWERIAAENCGVGEDKAQQLLARLYQGVEQRLQADEFADFSHYDRERRRVRAEFLEKAPKQASALAVMYEFMEDEVAKVAKRFFSRASMHAINSESQKDEQLFDLKLQVTDLTARLQSAEEALGDSRARERRAREELAAAQDEHAQEVLELDRGGSKALRELLADFEDAKRGKVEAELQVSVCERWWEGGERESVGSILGRGRRLGRRAAGREAQNWAVHS